MTSNSRALDAATRAHHASRTVVVGLLAAVWSLAFPSAAHASLLSPEAEDAMANFLNLHLALGGSFELPPQAPTTAASVGAPPSR